MTFQQVLDTKQKALKINLDNEIYGTFAEIGAGQEVCRHFFQAGGAAGTIAKTISAYDMTVSDVIYGKGKRYVSAERAKKMANREFDLLVNRLDNRGPSRFFAFSDTVAARSYRGGGECHGWLGVEFQHKVGAESSSVLIHVEMLDVENVQQQEALGILGVNLIFASFFNFDSCADFVASLFDGLNRNRIKIDMIHVEGKAFENVDSRLYSLELVQKRFCEAIMFDQKGQALRSADAIYKKNVLVARGSYRPPTLVNIDMLETGVRRFKSELDAEERKNVLVVPEISMAKLLVRGGNIDTEDFLARVDLLCELGHQVLVTNFETYFSLSQFVSKYGKKEVAFVTGVYNLEEIMDYRRYEEFHGGILTALGELFGHRTRLYIYPAVDDDDETQLRTMDSIKIFDEVMFLYLHLIENQKIQQIERYNPEISHIWSRTVLKMIETGDSAWEKMVPEKVMKLVKKKKLFGHKSGGQS